VGRALSGLCRGRPISAYRNGLGGPAATLKVRRRIALDPRGSRLLGASRRGRAEPTPIPGPSGGGPGVGSVTGGGTMGSRANRQYEEHILSVRLLGRISAEVDGRELKLTGRHAQALFALLALQPRPRSREAL